MKFKYENNEIGDLYLITIYLDAKKIGDYGGEEREYAGLRYLIPTYGKPRPKQGLNFWPNPNPPYSSPRNTPLVYVMCQTNMVS